MTTVYNKGQLVWAKIKGYPWWPASVGKSNEGKNGNPESNVFVYFVGENSHASIPIDRVYDFKEKYDFYATQKNKKLQECIKIALKIQNGVTTYEVEERQARTKKDQKERLSPTPEPKEESSQKPKKGRKKSENNGNEKSTVEKEKNDEEPPKPAKDEERTRPERSGKGSTKKDFEEEDTTAAQSKNKRGRKPKNAKEDKEEKDEEEDETKSISDSGAIDAAQLKKAGGRKLPITKVNQKKLANKTEVAREEEQIESDEEEQINKKKKTDNNKSLVYNDRYIKKLLKDLKGAADEFYKKFKNDEMLEEDDADLAKVIDYMGDMDSSAQFTSDLVTSDAGKLFKTIYIMAAKYKDNIPKKSQVFISNLQKTLHGMKNKILKFYFDNQDYLDAYDLNDRTESSRSKGDDIILNGSAENGKDDGKRKIDSQSILSFQKTFTSDSTPQKKDDGISLRRKVCQKLAKLIQSSCSIERDKSQELTLLIEGKIFSFYSDTGNQYKHCIKVLYKSIKDSILTIKELQEIEKMDYKTFQDAILSKAPLDLGTEVKDGLLDKGNEDEEKYATPKKEASKENDQKDSESDK